MSPKTKPAAVGDRLPYLLSKLKTPRVLERLEQTAATAREEGWPYEQFLEVLLETEVFARDASGLDIHGDPFPDTTVVEASKDQPVPGHHRQRIAG